MENFLQKFLNEGMLSIGDDDSKLRSLQAAAQEVAKELGKDRVKLITCTLCALDVNLSPDEYWVKSVEATIIKQWNTFRGKFRETPVQLVRAVMLAAMDFEATKQPSSAAVISFTATNYWPFTQLKNEEPLIIEWLNELREKVEIEARKLWASSAAVQSKNVSVELSTPKITWAKSDKAELEKQLLSATGPNGEHANPYNAYQHLSQWSTHFSSYAAQGIATALDSQQQNTANQIATSLTQLVTQINSQLPSIIAQVETNVKAAGLHPNIIPLEVRVSRLVFVPRDRAVSG